MSTENPPVQVGDRIMALKLAFTTEMEGKQATVERRCGTNHIYCRFEDGDTWCVTRWRLATPEPYAPERGHRVRVVLEGEVQYASNDHYFTLAGSGDTDVSLNGEEVVSIERLPDPEPPEPEFQPGDVVRDAEDHLYVRVQGYFVPETGNSYPWLRNGVIGHGEYDRKLVRPLTPLVLNGQPVGGAR